jgi:hypothetical protein
VKEKSVFCIDSLFDQIMCRILRQVSQKALQREGPVISSLGGEQKILVLIIYAAQRMMIMVRIVFTYMFSSRRSFK